MGGWTTLVSACVSQLSTHVEKCLRTNLEAKKSYFGSGFSAQLLSIITLSEWLRRTSWFVCGWREGSGFLMSLNGHVPSDLSSIHQGCPLKVLPPPQ